MQFSNTDGYTGLPFFLHDGGDMDSIFVVYMERNKRTPLDTGDVQSYTMGSVRFDITKFGKYGECLAEVKSRTTGRVESWPFSMLYIKQQ